MDDRESIALFGSEMIALVPLLRRHFTTLASLWETPDSGDFIRAEGECRRLLQAVTDLSAAYHATDCAMLGAALLHLVADEEKRMRVAMSIPTIAGSIDYLAARANDFTHFRRVVAPSAAEEDTQQRLIAQLRGVEESGVSPISAHEAPRLDSAVASDDAEFLDADPEVVAGAITYYESFEDPVEVAPLERTHPASDLYGDEEPPTPTNNLNTEDWDAIRAFQSSRLLSAQTTFPDGSPPVENTVPESALAELDEIPPELRDFFRREAADDLRQLRLLVARIEQDPADGDSVAEMRRGIHKLKGSAAQFGFTALARAAHELEDMLRILERQQVLPSPTILRAMDDLLDAMEDARTATSAEPIATSAHPALLPYGAANTAAEREPTPLAAETPAAITAETRALRVPPHAKSDQELRLALREVDDLTAHVQALVFARAGLAATQADALEMHGDFQRIVDRLRRVGAELGDLEQTGASLPDATPPWRAHEADHGMPEAGAAHNKVASSAASRSEPSAWDVARHRELSQTANTLHEIAADLAAESASLRAMLERLAQASDGQAEASEDLQRAVMRMRLVPLGDLLPHLKFELKRVQRSAGKLVSLTMQGEDIQIDRNVCDALREPLTQLVRNAVLHGIEPPEERLAAGKPEQGEIWIHATCTGGDIVLEIGDDGQGVSSEALISAALAVGVLDPQSPDDLSASRTMALMFEPAVTTTPEARLLGGRGIGLDEVRTAIERLGGSVSARTHPGRGSVFRIQTPISLTTMRVLHVVASGAIYAVPFRVVARTVLMPPSMHAPYSGFARTLPRVERVPFVHGELANADEAERDGEDLPIFSLDALLDFEEPQPAGRYALVIDSARGRAAVLVEELVDEREVLVQTLPRHLQRRALRGTTITPRGELALIVDMAALVERALSGTVDRAQEALPRATSSQAQPAPRVLVVDDSEAVRHAIELILRRGGFVVDQAANGAEALDAIATRPPDVVLLDIEMPRMGGIELLSALSGSWPQGLRVIMLTSRGSQEHMERAMHLGASAYLIKPCPQDLLLDTIRSVLVTAALRS